MPAEPAAPDSSDVARLRRWEDFGGTWQVVARTATTTTVSLCRCDGGEEADRFTSEDPQLLALVHDACEPPR